MTFVHGKNTRVLVNEKSYSGKLNSVSVSLTPEHADVTVFGNDGHRFIEGLVNGTLSLAGSFDDDPDSSLASSLGVTDSLVITVGPNGLAHGKPAILTVNDPSSYSIEAGVADAVTMSAETQADDGVDLGYSLHALSSEDESGESDELDNSTATTNGAVAALHVTAATGVEDRKSAVVQHSVDNTTWVDLITFDQAE